MVFHVATGPANSGSGHPNTGHMRYCGNDEGGFMDIPRRPYLRFNEFGGTSLWFTGVPDPPCDVPDVEEKVEEATEKIRRLERRMQEKPDDAKRT